MAQMPAHSPLPWSVKTRMKPHPSSGDYLQIASSDKTGVADFLTPEDAALIVRAVNSHAALVAALEACRDGYLALANESPHHKDERFIGYVALADRASVALSLAKQVA